MKKVAGPTLNNSVTGKVSFAIDVGVLRITSSKVNGPINVSPARQDRLCAAA